jgi:hypothetical protein
MIEENQRMSIKTRDLKPEGYYWGRRHEGRGAEIVQISTVFGEDPEFLTVAVMGSEEHHDLQKFEFLAEIDFPDGVEPRVRAN